MCTIIALELRKGQRKKNERLINPFHTKCQQRKINDFC